MPLAFNPAAISVLFFFWIANEVKICWTIWISDFGPGTSTRSGLPTKPTDTPRL
jgi:hypothetical protein